MSTSRQEVLVLVVAIKLKSNASQKDMKLPIASLCFTNKSPIFTKSILNDDFQTGIFYLFDTL